VNEWFTNISLSEYIMDHFPVVWNTTKKVTKCFQVFRRIVSPSWVRVRGPRSLPCGVLSHLTQWLSDMFQIFKSRTPLFLY